MSKVTVRVAVLVDGEDSAFTASAPMMFKISTTATPEAVARAVSDAIEKVAGEVTAEIEQSLPNGATLPV